MGSLNFGKNLAAAGKLSFSWDDPTVHGVTVPDDAAIFALRFDVIGSSGSVAKPVLIWWHAPSHV
jgi:hypothetical protein